MLIYAFYQYTLIEILMLKIELATKKTGIIKLLWRWVTTNAELKRLNDEGKNNWKTCSNKVY